MQRWQSWLHTNDFESSSGQDFDQARTFVGERFGSAQVEVKNSKGFVVVSRGDDVISQEDVDRVIQASETIKEILGIGETLADRLLIYDALEMKFRKVRRPKDPACRLCGIEGLGFLLWRPRETQHATQLRVMDLSL